MAHVLYGCEHKNYSYALFMKIIKRWYSLYHKGDCFFSMSRRTRMHSDSFSWLCRTRRRELGVALEELCHSMLWHFGVEGNYEPWFLSEHSQGTLFCSFFEISRTCGYLEAAVMMNADSASMLRCLPAWRESQGYLGSSGVSTMSINTVILPIQSTLLWNPSYE